MKSTYKYLLRTFRSDMVGRGGRLSTLRSTRSRGRVGRPLRSFSLATLPSLPSRFLRSLDLGFSRSSSHPRLLTLSQISADPNQQLVTHHRSSPKVLKLTLVLLFSPPNEPPSSLSPHALLHSSPRAHRPLLYSSSSFQTQCADFFFSRRRGKAEPNRGGRCPYGGSFDS